MQEPGAAVAIVHTREPVGSILLMRRSERADDPWSGHWSFPGGRCDPDDIDLLETALRELAEECGVELRRDDLETALPPVPARRREAPSLVVAPFVFRVDRELPTVLDAREASSVSWIPLEALLDPRRHALRPVPGMPREILFPSIDVNGFPLWGFTYRLITDWLGLIPTGSDRKAAGFETASRVLDLLVSSGLLIEQPWEDGRASVAGTIPVPLVLDHLPAPGNGIPSLNAIDVRPHRIRITGLCFEEYVIDASDDFSDPPRS